MEQLKMSTDHANRIDGHMLRSKAIRIQRAVPHKSEFYEKGADPEFWQALHDRVKEDSSLSRASAEQQRYLLNVAVEEGYSWLKPSWALEPEAKIQGIMESEFLDGDVAAFEVIHEPGVSNWTPIWAAAKWSLACFHALMIIVLGCRINEKL